jgi:hypothetical protein
MNNTQIGFILVILGFILLSLKWMTFFGWMFVILAFVMSIVYMLANLKNAKSGVGWLVILIFIIIPTLMLIIVMPVITSSFEKTKKDINQVKIEYKIPGFSSEGKNSNTNNQVIVNNKITKIIDDEVNITSECTNTTVCTENI